MNFNDLTKKQGAKLTPVRWPQASDFPSGPVSSPGHRSGRARDFLTLKINYTVIFGDKARTSSFKNDLPTKKMYSTKEKMTQMTLTVP